MGTKLLQKRQSQFILTRGYIYIVLLIPIQIDRLWEICPRLVELMECFSALFRKERDTREQSRIVANFFVFEGLEERSCVLTLVVGRILDCIGNYIQHSKIIFQIQRSKHRRVGYLLGIYATNREKEGVIRGNLQSHRITFPILLYLTLLEGNILSELLLQIGNASWRGFILDCIIEHLPPLYQLRIGFCQQMDTASIVGKFRNILLANTLR